uniref:Dicer 2 n=1 Tax=Graminella nigrifrons TaxID=30127 RepID=A0A0A7DVT8_GRANI|nr:dicer 2 [Graminella nigrifrons]
MGDGKPDDVDHNDFTPRDYQVQLAEMAIEKNKIIFLPTGSGKTFISSMVMTHFLKIEECATKKIGNGGKRGFFLVNTVALVHQQVEQIRTNTPFEVKGYCGDMGVDMWEKDTWNREIEEHGILVMTSQILVNLLSWKYVTLRDIAIIVFDECHHAVNDHPMRQIMQLFKNIPASQQPRILGLTATLLNKNVAVNKVDEEIRNLETTFLSQIATADDENLVKVYSTNPQESRVVFRENDKSGPLCAERDKILAQWIQDFRILQINDRNNPMRSIKPDGTFQIEDKSKKSNKEIKNVVTDIQVNMDELGAIGGQEAVLARIVQMEKMLLHCGVGNQKRAFCIFHSDLSYLQKFLEVGMGNNDIQQRLKLHSAHKVKKLLSIFKKMKEDDHAIVFVKRRFTAKIMYKIVSKAAKVDPKLQHIKCDFVVGYNVANPFKDTRENILQRSYNDRVLKKFNSGLLNVIFGSNVVEEGMDVSKCNMVIMFDAPMDYRSYTQSKGRARHSTSQYIIMTSDPAYNAKYTKFQEVQTRLRHLLCGGLYKDREPPSKDTVDATLFAEIPGLEPYEPSGKNGPCVTALSAITHVNRYFMHLKMDKFTKITPFWFMESKGMKYKCHLYLPMESKCRGIVEGTWQQNQENAKRSAALEACKKLHQNKELDDEHLQPITEETKAEGVVLPNWDSTEKFEKGTKKNQRLWTNKWPECLSGCMPVPKKEMFLHVLQLRPQYIPPEDNHRLVVFHEILSSPVTYAIVSSKPLPQLAPFPLYLSTGEMEVTVESMEPRSFTEDELEKISRFHGIIFNKIMGVVKSFLIRDYNNGQNSYLIAPLVFGSNGFIDVDWEVIEKANLPFPDPFVRPTEEARTSIVIDDNHYLGKIVAPWYRALTGTKYIVTKVCYDMDENTAFPTNDYESYKDYFKDKYKITPKKENQPLLEVRAISSRMNNLKPISLTKALKRKKDENEEFEIWLVPEFCHLYPVPGDYWVKALLLPSVLHRLSQLCMAEELRLRIVRETDVGKIQIPALRKLEADASLAKQLPIADVTQSMTPLSINLANNHARPEAHSGVWSRDEEPVDIDREMEVSVFDILNYEMFANAPLSNQPAKGNVFTQKKEKKEMPVFVDPPALKMLKKKVSDFGPEQVHLLQAITTALANDFVNCERPEMLGDSFLKFAVSLVLFETQGDVSEGALTSLKGRIVGNKNLFFCGRNKELSSILNVKDFSPREEWLAPQFCVEHTISATIVNGDLDSSCLYNMNIPEEDVIAGNMSKATRKKVKEILLEADFNTHAKTCVFTDRKALADKAIADAVEAVLGVYLENAGIFGALHVMNWFGVMDQKLATDCVFTDKLTSPRKNPHGSIGDHLIMPSMLEDILQYKFKDRAYLLQALSHPSYQRNYITQCYQRLEFLGDAIIDFLITIHIYERFRDLHPGDLTDLRSALVNNITLGCITVRNGLQRFLLHRSSDLNEVMRRFVQHQEQREHKIDNDILFLCEEYQTMLSESIEVPKALGDVFEALIGAVYLDSGKNLDVVWKIIFNLMKSEIETFHSNVPKNHVRMLYESNCQPSFSSSIAQDGVVKVSVEFTHRGEKTLTCHGFGDNKYNAKRAAAKHALRAIHKLLDNQ